MITSLVTSVGVLLGVAFTAFGLYYTAQTLRATQEGQITDRYTKAVEQLASPAVDVRLGAIYALLRIANDSQKDRPTIRSVLAAYVRNHDFCVAQQPPFQCNAKPSELGVSSTAMRVPADVYAAINSAVALGTGTGEELADFTRARFPRVDFPKGVRLSYADLTFAELPWAQLWDADLSFMKAEAACFIYANMTEADLSKADLQRANLTRVQLGRANLAGADLRGANLRGVFGMTPEEIRAVAVTDSETRFGDLTPAEAAEMKCG